MLALKLRWSCESSAYECTRIQCQWVMPITLEVYKMKRIGPRTLPCGTPQSTGDLLYWPPVNFTLCVRSSMKDLIHERTVPWMPKAFCRRLIRMELSTVSNAVEDREDRAVKLHLCKQRNRSLIWALVPPSPSNDHDDVRTVPLK